ncbi:dipeptidase 1 (renal) [Borealophlyctis nickersoniae]|nr:dipeptidase 1 (renal) [Borealophlyctis nickersoniae]
MNSEKSQMGVPSNKGGDLPHPATAHYAGRRSMTANLTAAFITLLAGSYLFCNHVMGAGSGLWESKLDDSDYLGRAQRIMERVPVIDGHNDLPIKLQFYEKGQINHLNLTNLPSTYNTDITRLREGRMGGVFWSAFIPCTSNLAKVTDDVRFTLEQVDLIKHIVRSYPKTFELASSAKDIRRIYKHGRIASLIGLEGAHQVDNSLGNLRMLYELGARYMTLTHVCHTPWADSCTPPPEHHGLTPFGERFILEMNRIGMMVDLSHVSHDTMRHVLRVTKAPVLFSHSSAYSLCQIPRNVPDDVLQNIHETDGVVMVNFYPVFDACSPNGTLSIVADHLEHIAKTAGVKHVGFGSDFDGIDSVPVGLEDVSKYPNLVAELLRRGFSETDVEGIVGGNLLRVMEGVERVRDEMQREEMVEDKLFLERSC